MNIMDFANDDNFRSSWQSNKSVQNPWYEVDLGTETAFNMIILTEGSIKSVIRKYRLDYYEHGVWKTLLTGTNEQRIKVHRFDRVWGSKVRIVIETVDSPPSIAEFGVYNERYYSELNTPDAAIL